MSPMVRLKPVSKVYLEVYLTMVNRPFRTIMEIRAWKPTNINSELRGVSGAKGLRVRGQHTGTKKFVAFKSYNGDVVPCTIGSIEKVGLESARTLTNLIGYELKKNSLADVRKALVNCAGDHTLFQEELKKAKAPAVSGMTVDEFMEEWLPIKQASLADGPSRRRPESLYRMHFQPIFGRRPISEVRDIELFKFFENLYREKYTTGSKLRGEMGQAFANAKNKGYIDSNPIPHGRDLPKRPSKPKPHRTMAHSLFPPFWKAVETSNFSGSTKALIFAGLVTCQRFSAIRRVQGKHVDVKAGIWKIPAIENKDTPYRIKSGDAFVMRLPEEFWQKLSVLTATDITAIDKDDFVFTSPTRKGVPVSSTNISKCIQSTGFDTTFHGFRNAIKIWGRENKYEDYLMDSFSQHSLRGLDRAYRREEYIDERFEVSEALLKFILADEAS